MVTKCVCDLCGGDGAGRATLQVARGAPLEMPTDFPRIDHDLCQRCFDTMLRTVQSIIPNLKRGSTAT